MMRTNTEGTIRMNTFIAMRTAHGRREDMHRDSREHMHFKLHEHMHCDVHKFGQHMHARRHACRRATTYPTGMHMDRELNRYASSVNICML